LGRYGGAITANVLQARQRMSSGPLLRSARANAAGAELSVAELFTLLWDALADILGTAATATLLRRAARGATLRCAELDELAIARENLEYRYTVPPGWENGGPPIALRELVTELRPLLVELTGPIVLRRLEAIPELRQRGIISPQEEEER